jgi:hypothetical protein
MTFFKRIPSVCAGQVRRAALYNVVLITALLCMLFPASIVRAEDDILPLKSVHAGMKGVGLSVFEGNTAEKFGVEVLGVLTNTGPKRNTILARLSERNLENTGVAAGMSGSPVYIDGKLVGAVAWSWAFSKTPIAGITPIEEMRDVKNVRGPELSGSPVFSRLRGRYDLTRLLAGKWSDLSSVFESSPEQKEEAGNPAMHPANFPIVFSGFDPSSIERFRPIFSSLGFTCLSGSSGAGPAGSRTESSGGIEAGDAVAVQFIRGDLSVSAFGTVTERRGEDVLAFGHPIFDSGSVDWPMAKADVVTTIPSLYFSFKVADIGPAIGRFVQDRSAGVLGRLGEPAQIIPVSVELDTSSRDPEVYHFDILKDKNLSPMVLELATASFLESLEKAVGETTIRLDARFDLDGLPALSFQDVYAGKSGAGYSATLMSAILDVLLDNPFGRAPVRGVKLAFSSSEEEKTAYLRRVRLDKPKWHAGDRVPLRVYLRSRSGEDFSREFQLDIPEQAQPGKYLLLVSSGRTLQSVDSSFFRETPDSLAQLVEFINRIKKNSHLYAALFQLDAGFTHKGERFSLLPPSVSAVFQGGSSAETLRAIRRAKISEASLPTDFYIDGYKVLNVEIVSDNE